MAKFVDASSLEAAIETLRGTAGPFFPIWLVLKQMGLSEKTAVAIDTTNSKDALQRLFGYGDPDGRFYFPIAHTDRYLHRASDSARSVVQTNIRQWADGTGTKSPNGFLDVRSEEGGKLRVATKRSYPVGLGVDENGFAVAEGLRVALPETAWAVWYGRRTAIPDEAEPTGYLVSAMRQELGISEAEAECVFIPGTELPLTTSAARLEDHEVYEICEGVSTGFVTVRVADTPLLNRGRVELTKTTMPGPAWLSADPAGLLKGLIEDGHTAILLTGPPRTGKTRAVKALTTGKTATTLQLHDGWTYDQLMLAQVIRDGAFDWEPGPLLRAVRDQQDFIVLEEANRTRLSQAMGEVFSLIEPAYRGPEHGISLRDGSSFYVPASTVFLLTMNTVDKSTEDLDDALLGRVRAVDFYPRIESLREILGASHLGEQKTTVLATFFTGVQHYYPLGHGYFAGLDDSTDLVTFYLSAIRPVISSHFAAFEPDTLSKIDNLFDEVVVQAIDG